MHIWGLNGPNGPNRGPTDPFMGRPKWVGPRGFCPWAGPCPGLTVGVDRGPGSRGLMDHHMEVGLIDLWVRLDYRPGSSLNSSPVTHKVADLL